MAVIVLLNGCTTASVYSPEHLYHENDKDITVYMNDGRIIKFKNGEYAAFKTEGGFIKGKGKLIINDFNNTFKEWEGTITFSEVKSVTTSQPPPLGDALPYIMVGTTAFFVWLVLARPTISMH
jgi:hypothetical protein